MAVCISAHLGVCSVEHELEWLTNVYKFTEQARMSSLYVRRSEDCLSDSQAKVSSNTFTVCASVDTQKYRKCRRFLKGIWLFYIYVSKQVPQHTI